MSGTPMDRVPQGMEARRLAVRMLAAALDNATRPDVAAIAEQTGLHPTELGELLEQQRVVRARAAASPETPATPPQRSRPAPGPDRVGWRAAKDHPNPRIAAAYTAAEKAVTRVQALLEQAEKQAAAKAAKEKKAAAVRETRRQIAEMQAELDAITGAAPCPDCGTLVRRGGITLHRARSKAHRNPP